MAYHSPAQLYAQFQTKDGSPGVMTTDDNNRPSSSQRILVFREVGYASSPPDRIKCVVSCSSVKKTAEEARTSTERRVDYIKQTLRNNSMKESQHYHVHSMLSNVVNSAMEGDQQQQQYRMSVEVSITFNKSEAYEMVISLLTEKLDASVQVSEGVFYVSAEKRSELRRQACLDAVRNCRSKALSVAQYLNQTLGAALTVREEKTFETIGNSPAQEPNTAPSFNNQNNINGFNAGTTSQPSVLSINQRIADATVSVHANVYAEFEIKERTRKANGVMKYS